MLVDDDDDEDKDMRVDVNEDEVLSRTSMTPSCVPQRTLLPPLITARHCSSDSCSSDRWTAVELLRS